MTTYNPSVDITIFPRVNYLKNFDGRAIRRGLNGRIYGEYGRVSIDTTDRYPIADGALEASTATFPWDLGPAVTTTPTELYDLREDGGTPSIIDLNPLN